MRSLLENETWELIILPPTVRTLSPKWVFKLKRGNDGEITRYKARWVVKGYIQTQGIDYNKTFAFVMKPQSYKTVFALAAAQGWELEQMDISTAFFYGEVEEDICVIQPIGIENGRGQTCKLRKALYGLKQASRIWSMVILPLIQTVVFITSRIKRLTKRLSFAFTLMMF